MADGAIRNLSVKPSDRRSVGASVIWKEEKLIGPSVGRAVGGKADGDIKKLGPSVGRFVGGLIGRS